MKTASRVGRLTRGSIVVSVLVLALTVPLFGAGPSGTTEPGQIQLAVTTLGPDGNRLVPGTGTLPDLDHLDIPVRERPAWVVGAPSGDGVIWVAVSDSGQATGFYVDSGSYREVRVTPPVIPAGMPPALVVDGGETGLVFPPDGASPLSNAVTLSDGRLAFIDSSGDLIIWTDHGETALPVNALPDARILTDDDGRLLLLSHPTDQYAHGIMGDTFEAGAITLVETKPPEISRVIRMPVEWVIEGLSPIWIDMDGDGEREIIVTRSNSRSGAQLAIYSESGTLKATGSAIGMGNRWRHQIAVGPFGPGGQVELVEVLTPHIGGPTGFYRWDGERLVRIAAISGYTSHVILSRNLDMAMAGDFDGQGLAVLLPDRSRRSLGAIRHEDSGAAVQWSLDLPGRLVTNVAAVTTPNGRIAVAIGTEDNVIRVWQE